MRLCSTSKDNEPAQQHTSAPSGARAAVTPFHRILQLQRLVGNQAVSRMMSPRLQPQLRVGPADDVYEREADRIADQVMRMAEPGVQRCAHCEAEDRLDDGPILRHVVSRSTAHVQREGTDAGTPADAPSIVGEVLSEPGRPLDPNVRSFMEPRFGHDFSDVQIHTGSRAAESARAVNAVAYTVGRDVVFNEGAYRPDTDDGRRLLAHELTHVIQQGHADVSVERDMENHVADSTTLQGRVQPHIQRLTITQQTLTKSTCGGRNVQWVFSLDKPAPEDGYIVQQIDRSEYVATCPDVAYGPPAPLPTFWEAWFVKKGDKVDWTTTRDKWTDGNSRPPRPATNGTDSADGTVKFFLKKTTGDLGDFNKASSDPASPWGPGNAPSSGALPSTTSQPSWWSGAPDEGPANRSVLAYWNCCDADRTKHVYDLTAKP